MAVMTYEELNSVWELKRQLARAEQHLTFLNDMLAPTTSRLDGRPHAKPADSKLERLIAQKVDGEKHVSELGDLLIQRKLDLLGRIDELPLTDLQAQIFAYHFVSCLKLGKVAAVMNYSRRWVEKQLAIGLQALGLAR